MDTSLLLGLAARRILGIRTAARKKVGRPPRMPIATIVVNETAKAIKHLFPKIRKLHLVGSRLRHKYARDLDFVAVVRSVQDLPGRNLTIRVGNLGVNIFVSLPDEVETHILEFGLGLDTIRWKRSARAHGFILNRFGLWRNGTKVSGKMAEIAALIGMPLKPHLIWSLKNPF